MSNRAIRMYEPDQPYDEWDKQAQLLNFGIRPSTSRWNEVAGNEANRSIQYNVNTYVPDTQLELDLKFDSVFTVCFWAKFLDSVPTSTFVLALEDGTKLSTEVTISDNDWHYYAVSRNVNNDIRMFVDGVMESTTINSSVTLNLCSNSFVLLGDPYTDNKIVVDDLCIVEGALYTANFTLPTDYIDLFSYRSYLVIEISSGKVWGYGEVV